MKRTILITAVACVISVSANAQTKESVKNETQTTETQAASYSCPMKCEGDKTYTKKGSCPTCGMDLVQKKAATVSYTCPMKCEGDKTYAKKGSCPKCGMDLAKSEEKKKTMDKDGHKGHSHH